MLVLFRKRRERVDLHAFFLRRALIPGGLLGLELSLLLNEALAVHGEEVHEDMILLLEFTLVEVHYHGLLLGGTRRLSHTAAALGILNDLKLSLDVSSARSVVILNERLAVGDFVFAGEQVHRHLSLAYVILGVAEVDNLFRRELALGLLFFLLGFLVAILFLNLLLDELIVLIEAQFDLSAGHATIVQTFLCDLAGLGVTAIFIRKLNCFGVLDELADELVLYKPLLGLLDPLVLDLLLFLLFGVLHVEECGHADRGTSNSHRCECRHGRLAALFFKICFHICVLLIFYGLC